MSHTIGINSKDKILLDALAAFLQLPPATVIERALVAYRESLSPEDQATLGAFCGRAIHNREALLSQAVEKTAKAGQPKAIYESTRFCFKRAPIEGLAPQERFRMITPVGVFEMSKADFYHEFPNVVASESYKKGVYHYPQLPSKAESFRVYACQ